MDMDSVRRRCEDRLRHMRLPDPFDLAGLCRTVNAERGRALHVRGIPGPATRARPCGIWVATDKDDWIFVDQETSPLHRQHIVLSRGSYHSEHEREAELLASLILARAQRATAVMPVQDVSAAETRILRQAGLALGLKP